MKISAYLMILLISLSFFAAGISSIVVDADSAAGGNDAANTENSATLIPFENNWYNGDVNSTSDENDYYTIDVNPGEVMEFEVTGPSQGSYWFYYKLNSSQNWAGPPGGYEILSGNSYVFSSDNQDTQQEQTLILYFQANQQHVGFDLDYCFKVNHFNNYSQPQNSNSCSPVVAPPAPSVSVTGTTEGTDIFWDIWYANLTSDTTIILNYTITLDSAPIVGDGQVIWTVSNPDDGFAPFPQNHYPFDTEAYGYGNWCIEVTLWQDDQDEHVEDSVCIFTSAPSIDVTALVDENGDAYGHFNITHQDSWSVRWGLLSITVDPVEPEWDWNSGWWDTDGINGGMQSFSGTYDEDSSTEELAEYGALPDDGCYVLMAALYDGAGGSEYLVSTDYSNFQLGDGINGDCIWWGESIDEEYLFVSTEQRHWDVVDDGVLIQFEAGGLDPSIEWVLEAQLFFLPGIIDPEPNYELEEAELMLTADSVNDPRYGISVDENGMSTFELEMWGLGDECYLLEYDVADKETLGTYMIGPFDHYFSVGMGDCGELIDNTVINDWCDQLEGFAGDVWDPLVTYSSGDVVEYPANSGQFYKAKTSTSGDIPSENSDAWEGPCTCEDIWQGQVWSSSVTYANLEIVEENGKLWISQLNNNNGHYPSNSPNWWRACSSECALANGSVGWWFDQNYQLYQIGDVVEYPANSGKYFVSTMNDNTAHPDMGELRGWVECSCSEIWEDGSQPNWDANSHYDTFEVVEHNGEFYVRTFAFNLPFSTTPEPEVDSTWRAAWKKCDLDRCDSTGPYSQYYADMGMYDMDVAVSASFGSSKVWISTVDDNMNPPPNFGFFSTTWAFCFKEPKPPIKPDLVADDWINPPGGIDDEIHRYARMMVGSVVSYTDEVTDQRIIDQRSGELCTDIDLDMYSGIDIKCEEIEVLVLGSETSTYGCFESWPSEEGKQLPWVEVCEFDDDSGPVVFENNPPIVVSSCDIDALNDVGVYIETNDMTDVGGHLLVESSGMNPGDLNCGAQILLIDQNIEDHSEEDGVEGRTKYTCPPGRCFTDADGDCWVKVTGEGWLEGSWDGYGHCDTSAATGNSPFPPWLNIQDVKVGEDTYYLVSVPGQTCDTVDLSNLMPGSTCSDAVTQIGQSTNPSTTSTSTRSPGGPCTDANHQLYQTIISSSAADTRWLGPNGLMQPSNLVTPDPSWGTFTTWGDAVWVGQPSHSSATTQPQSYFFSHEFTLPYHAKELDFSWHGMASDHFGLDQSNSKSGGVSIDGYPAAGFTEIILIDPATWNSAPHHDQEEQWTGGKTFTPVNPNQKYILQTIISNDDSQSIQGLIYELKVEFCLDPQYEHHLPDLPIMDEPDVDPGLPDLPIVDQVPDDSIPGFLGIIGVLALVAAAIINRKN